MTGRQSVNFSTFVPATTGDFTVSMKNCIFRAGLECVGLKRDGEIVLSFSLDQPKDILLNIVICSSTAGTSSNCPIDIFLNESPLLQNFDPKHYETFYEQSLFPLPSMTKSGTNTITIKRCESATTEMLIRDVFAEPVVMPQDRSKWMSGLSDAKPVSEINIPGTHDSAAINSFTHTPYACHYASISNQLEGGIRLLDVRIKVKKNNNGYYFATCHGDIGSATNINEYQSLVSLLDECKNFLTANNRETVIMTLKVDDWSEYKNDRENALNALEEVLSNYPLKSGGYKDLGTLGGLRGKIFLINRINDEARFGAPVSWTDATEGEYAEPSENRNFKVYVQDKYKGLNTFGSAAQKFELVKNAFLQKKDGEVVLNYASATWFGVMGVYIMNNLLSYFGSTASSSRLTKFGWTLFDYEFADYATDIYDYINVVDIIVSSNYGYSGYENKFTVYGGKL